MFFFVSDHFLGFRSGIELGHMECISENMTQGIDEEIVSESFLCEANRCGWWCLRRAQIMTYQKNFGSINEHNHGFGNAYGRMCMFDLPK